MKKILFFLQIVTAVLSILFFAPNVLAEMGPCLAFTSHNINLECEQDPARAYKNSGSLTLTFTITNNQEFPSQEYKIARWYSQESYSYSKMGSTYNITRVSDTKLSATINFDAVSIPEIGVYNEFDTLGIWNYKIFTGGINTRPNTNNTIVEGTYNIFPAGVTESGETGNEVGFPILTVLNARSGGFGQNENANLLIENVDISKNYTIWFLDKDTAIFSGLFNGTNTTSISTDDSVKGTKKVQLSISTEDELGKKTLCVGVGKAASINKSLLISDPPVCTSRVDFNVLPIAPNPNITPMEIRSSNPAIPSGDFEANLLPAPSPPCAEGCFDTATKKCTCVDTAIGQISTDPKTFVQSIFSIVLGLAGGIALILIMISGYKMMASQGNPEALTAARDQLISAIVGLLFIIFSFVILQVIGVDILRIPGFSAK